MFKDLGYLICLFLPTSVSLYLVSGPHAITAALAWTAPLWALLLADRLSPKVTSNPIAETPNRFLNGMLYALAFMQFLNIGLMLNYVSQLQWQTIDDFVTGIINLIVLRFMVGTSSVCSGIIVAHELIHRPKRHLQFLGRLLLCTVCYEHFAIAHKHGHHRNIGQPHDIATARLGESFRTYWKRVYLDHLRYAWHSETERLKIEGNPFLNVKTFQNRVLHGVLIEFFLVVSIMYFFGWIAALLFLYQAFAAVRILEAINFIQHWGLGADTPHHSIAWVNDSWVTKHVLLGLSCHIDHHNNAARHFHTLRYSGQGPKMPYGYFVMNFWVKLNNSSFQKMAMRELEKYDNTRLKDRNCPVEKAVQITS